MATELHTIFFGDKNSPPNGCRVEITLGLLPGTVNAKVWLNENFTYRNYPNLPIIDGVLTIPIKKVFINYAKEDLTPVKDIQAKLFMDGILSWFDENDLNCGDTLDHVIPDAIQNVDYAIIFWSKKRSEKVGYVHKEYQWILDYSKRMPSNKNFILTIVLDDSEPPNDLKNLYYLKTSDSNWYEKLLRSIK